MFKYIFKLVITEENLQIQSSLARAEITPYGTLRAGRGPAPGPPGRRSVHGDVTFSPL